LTKSKRQTTKWEQIKKAGSKHYKASSLFPSVEPIDLYREGGILRNFALCSIIKYAYRNRDNSKPVSISDMEKIRHYAEMLQVAYGEGK
jgi:hypothetical protein